MFTSNHYDWVIIDPGPTEARWRISWRRRGRTFPYLNEAITCGGSKLKVLKYKSSLQTRSFSFKRESPDYPSLRASDEYRFIVRVLRARRMVWWLPLPPFRDRALHEHRRPSSMPSHTPQGVV